MEIMIWTFLLFLISSIMTESPSPTPTTFEYNIKFIKLPYFIDKSELFLEIFRPRYGEHAFVTFPPKFGKTTNLLMLKKLLQFELDFDNRPKPMRRTSAYHLVQYLKLSQHEEAYLPHLAQHPVVFFDLKYDIEGKVTHEKLVAGLSSKVQQTFQEYDWLGDKLQRMFPHYEDFFHRALQAKLSEKELLDSLFVLGEILYNYFNQSKVVLLVDNFDYPSKYDFIDIYVTDPLYFMIHSIILNVTKTHYCVKRSLILSVSDRKVGIPLYGNIRQFPFLEEDYYAPFFGILPTELDELFERFQCSEQEKNNVKKWYAGYETNLIYRPIYNTYSIMEYFHHRKESNPLRPYWASVQDTTFITQFLRVTFFRTAFNELLQYGSIFSRFRKRRLLGDKKFLPNMTNDNKDIYVKNDKIKDLIGLLFEQGYLGHRNYIKEGSYKIPNLEIQNLLVSVTVEFYQSRGIPVTNVSSYLMSVLHETESSKDAANSEWNVLSMIIPIQKAKFNLSAESEYFNVIHLATLHIKLAVPEIEIIVKWLTSTARNDIILINNGKAMMINMNPDPNRIVPPDQYMCGCIRGRNISTVRLLTLNILGPYLVKCQVRTVECDS